MFFSFGSKRKDRENLEIFGEIATKVKKLTFLILEILGFGKCILLFIKEKSLTVFEYNAYCFLF